VFDSPVGTFPAKFTWKLRFPYSHGVWDSKALLEKFKEHLAKPVDKKIIALVD